MWRLILIFLINLCWIGCWLLSYYWCVVVSVWDNVCWLIGFVVVLCWLWCDCWLLVVWWLKWGLVFWLLYCCFCCLLKLCVSGWYSFVCELCVMFVVWCVIYCYCKLVFVSLMILLLCLLRIVCSMNRLKFFVCVSLIFGGIVSLYFDVMMLIIVGLLCLNVVCNVCLMFFECLMCMLKMLVFFVIVVKLVGFRLMFVLR